MYLPCDAVNEIVQRHFSKIYDRIDRYILQEKKPPQFSTFPNENIVRSII